MKLGIIFGGNSFEHEISIVSCVVLKDVLKSFELKFIFIDKDREFYLIDSTQMKSSLFSSGEYKKSPQLTLKKGGFFKKRFLGEDKIEFDTAINLIHGLDGEDGKLASIFEFFDIKYIGPRIEASAISFNKALTKIYAHSIGVKTIDYAILNINDKRDLDFDFPVIIKPLRLGSSIGVNIARDLKEFDYALDVAFEFDSDVLIEPFLEELREFNLAGFKADKFIFSNIEEPKKTKEFLDFEKKYLDFARSEAETKELDEDLELELKEEFAKVYSNLFEGALIRCDFFLYQNRIYLNEINPIPGSLANYLFNDFQSNIKILSENLPNSRVVNIDYRYINSIQNAKGKG